MLPAFWVKSIERYCVKLTVTAGGNISILMEYEENTTAGGKDRHFVVLAEINTPTIYHCTCYMYKLFFKLQCVLPPSGTRGGQSLFSLTSFIRQQAD